MEQTSFFDPEVVAAAQLVARRVRCDWRDPLTAREVLDFWNWRAENAARRVLRAAAQGRG